jgi:hypothetical protein
MRVGGGALRTSLSQYPLFLAPALPPVRSPAHRIVERVEETTRLLQKVPRVDAVYAPELVDENHEGRPRYRTYDPREYLMHVHSRTGRPGIVTKVVAHLDGTAPLLDWAERTLRIGITDVVLVGGSSSRIRYPGPAVEEADRAVAPLVGPFGGTVGNIAIPQRSGEAARMLRKTQAGASFLTTQLLFDAGDTIDAIREYGRLCRSAGVEPATIVLSFAPLGDEDDLEFVRWLGAHLPEAVEQALLQDEQALSRRSVELALSVWTEVEAATSAVDVPLGVSVEQVSARNLTAVQDLLRSFTDLLPPRPTAVPLPPTGAQ